MEIKLFENIDQILEEVDKTKQLTIIYKYESDVVQKRIGIHFIRNIKDILVNKEECIIITGREYTIDLFDLPKSICLGFNITKNIEEQCTININNSYDWYYVSNLKEDEPDFYKAFKDYIKNINAIINFL